jgi:hypothetical protein
MRFNSRFPQIAQWAQSRWLNGELRERKRFPQPEHRQGTLPTMLAR